MTSKAAGNRMGAASVAPVPVHYEDVPVLTARQQKELLRLPDKRTRLGKRNAALLAILVRSVSRVVATWLWLLPGRNGEHLSVRAAQNAVQRYIRKVRPVAFRVHDIRHTAATDPLRASGDDVWITAKMLGHVDTRQVVRTYAHHLTKDALRAAEARSAALLRHR